MAKINDIMKDIAANDLDAIREFPKCSSNDYRCPQADGLPATRYIPIRPDTPNMFRRVCENCYYDYEFEGIYTYSYKDEHVWIENKSEEERFRLRSKLYRDSDWRDK